MLGKKEYYEIIIKDNNLATVNKIYYDKYNDFKNTFEYVYHTEKGETYPLDKKLEKGTDVLIVDDEHLHELLKDLFDQSFCDEINIDYISCYDGYGLAF